MSDDLIITLLLLGACVALFIYNRPRMDAVALLALLLLPLLGIITVPEALAGFSDPSVILIAALFVVGEGLVRTGIAYRIGDLLVDNVGGRPKLMLVLMMAAVAGLGAFMSSTGVVAIFIPIVLNVARRLNMSAGNLMMPLSFAGLISGMMTLVATPPNMVLDGALKRSGFEGLRFFSFTPIGIVVLGLGIAYMLFARRWLTPRALDEGPGGTRRTLQHLIDDYQLAERGHSLRVKADSPLIGKTLDELLLRRKVNANVIAIRRRGRFHAHLITPTAKTALQPDDMLLVDMARSLEGAPEVPPEFGIDVMELRGSYFSDQAREVGMAEVLLPPESDLLKKTLHEAQFRKKYRLNVVGIRRGGKPLGEQFLEEKLRLGDTLLVIGPWNAIRNLQTQQRDFVVLSLPAEIDTAAPVLSKAPFAVASLVTMIVLMVSGVVPNVLAALIACLMMGAFGCLKMNHAYKAINWESLIVIVGMMPFAVALQKTGGVQLAVEGLMNLLGDSSLRAVLACLFVVTALTGLFISNTATAVLMAPVAIAIADQLKLPPHPFAMTVAIAASAAFMAPISSPVNMLVLGPGNYRFMDFVKVGVPFTLLVLVVTIIMVPWLLPLR